MHGREYRATLVVMMGLVAATLTGFLREAAVASQLGASRATDVFLIAFTIPEFLFVALPIVLTPAFLPLFAMLRVKRGEAAAWRFALRVAAVLLALLLAVTILFALLAPRYLAWLAPGFGPEERSQALQALGRMLPAISLMGMAALVGAMLQVYRHFTPPALSTATYNVTFVAALLALPLVWPVGRAAWGVTLGATAALAIQLPLLWHQRPATIRAQTGGSVSESPAILPGAESALLWDLARLAGPLAAGYAVHHAILFVDRALATTLAAGSVASLNYAYRLALVVGQLSGLAVSTTAFPRMAEQAAAGDLPGQRATLESALRFVWLIGLPAAAGLIVLRVPLVQVVFQRGAFGQAATATVSDLLIWYAPAVLADALCQPLWRALYAWRSTWSAVGVNGLQTFIRLLADVALIRPLGYNGLALSAALGLVVQLIVLGWLVRRRLGSYLSAGWWREAIGAALAAIPALLMAACLAHLLSGASAPLIVVVAGLVGSLSYLLVLRLCHTRWLQPR